MLDSPTLFNKEVQPILKDSEHNYAAIIVQERNILKVAFYFNKNLEDLFALLYIEELPPPNFKNQAVKFTLNGRGEYGIVFEDGKIFYSSLPKDTYKMHTPELSFEVRWQRVYKNYYIVTVFRGSGDAVMEELMTEKDWKDLTPVLGDSSGEGNPHSICGYSVGHTIWLQYRYRENNKYIYSRVLSS